MQWNRFRELLFIWVYVFFCLGQFCLFFFFLLRLSFPTLSFSSFSSASLLLLPGSFLCFLLCVILDILISHVNCTIDITKA